MAKLKLSPEVAALNKDVDLTGPVRVGPARASRDRAPEFLGWWQMVKAQERDYRAWPWPDPVAEYPFDDQRHWRFDAAWPSLLVAVEIDGGRWAAGGGRHAGPEDHLKLNQAAALGWRVLRFAPAEVEADPAGTVLLVVAALGWGITRP